MIRFKRGDTFLLTCVYSVDGTPTTLPAVRAQLRDKDGNLVQELSFAALPDVGYYTLNATAAEAAAWPLGQLECDIQYGDPSEAVSSTPTFFVMVMKDITHD